MSLAAMAYTLILANSMSSETALVQSSGQSFVASWGWCSSSAVSFLSFLLAQLLNGFLQQRSGLRNWDDCAQDAFEDLNSALITAPVLTPPDWSKPFRVHIDASRIAVEGHINGNGLKRS